MSTKGKPRSGSVRFDVGNLRRERGDYTQEEFSEMCGVKVYSYRRAERGATVSHSIATSIAAFINKGIEDISDNMLDTYNKSKEKRSSIKNEISFCFNFNPETGVPEEDFGRRDCPSDPGRISFVKWRDPGGKKYRRGWPYDRPNRVLMVRRLSEGRRLWWEYNLTSVNRGKETWRPATHVWTEVDHEFPAIGNHRVGLVLFRIDAHTMIDSNGRIKVLEFFIPNDSIEALRKKKKPTIWMRWTTEKEDFQPETRKLVSSRVPFENTGFEIVSIGQDTEI